MTDPADRSFHGGVDKGEYDLNAAAVGERWTLGSALLEVSEPRFPCFKLGIRMGDPQVPEALTTARRPGTYLRILE